MKKLLYAITAFISLFAITAVAVPKAHASGSSVGANIYLDADQDHTANEAFESVFGTLDYYLKRGEKINVDNEGLYLNGKKIDFDKHKNTYEHQYLIKIEAANIYLDADQDHKVNAAFNSVFGTSDYKLKKGERIEIDDKGLYFNGKEISFSINKNTYEHQYQIIITNIAQEAPAVQAENKLVLNNVSTPYNLDQIKQVAKIKVIDNYDGDITHLMKVKTDNFTANKNKIGTSSVTYTVTNSGGLTTEYIQQILTFDNEKPSVTGESSTRLSYTQEITTAEIASKYTVTDNYDKDIKLELVSTDYVKNKVGTYTFVFKAVDSSKNETRVTHTLYVIDDIAPILVDTLKDFKVTYTQVVTDSLLVSGLTASDAVDGDLTKNIKVKSHNIKQGKLGVYNVVFEVKDNAGNIATLERPLEVITLDYPVYYISKDMITVEDANKLTIDQIAVLYAKLNDIDMDSYTVLTNEYDTNESKVGMHLLSMNILDKKGDKHLVSNTFNVVSITPEPELPWYETAWNWLFNHVLKYIANFFIAIANGVIWIAKIFGSGWNYIPFY